MIQVGKRAKSEKKSFVIVQSVHAMNTAAKPTPDHIECFSEWGAWDFLSLLANQGKIWRAVSRVYQTRLGWKNVSI